ncbi:hypothetical protein P4233_31105 [Pseudomonas aeruginosa]|nr:hypothetical protein [Pseudomonas aeruginosa]
MAQSRILDQFGRPIGEYDQLVKEIATPQVTGVRQVRHAPGGRRPHSPAPRKPSLQAAAEGDARTT